MSDKVNDWLNSDASQGASLMRPHSETDPTPDSFSSEWKVHTYNLLSEIVNCSGQAILEKPINIFGKLLAAVGERASELNDIKLNALMCQLTIYTVADPNSPDYDPEVVRAVITAAREISQP